jgi:large subunit ribosomal protein L15
VNVKDLSRFDPGTEITPDVLRDGGVVKKSGPIKLLSMGDLSGAYTIKLHRVSAAAKEKIEAAGGTVEEI